MTPQAPHRHMVPVLISIGLAVAMVSSVGSPMVPTVADEYHVSLAASQWTLTISLLSGAIVTPVLGRLGDGRRRREMILGALVTICAGGFVAAIPGPFWLLLAARALQGVGLGLMPMAMAVARDHLSPARSGPAIAALSITTATGVGLGYPVSGFLADTIGFHGTHLVVALTVAVVIAAAYIAVPNSRHLTPKSFDVAASLLLAIGVGSIVIASAESSSWGLGSARLLGLVALAAVFVALWAWRDLRVPNPLVELRTLRYPAVRAAQSGAVLAGVGMFFTMAIIIRYVQTPTSVDYGLGGSVLVAGLLLVPFSLASLVVHRLLPVLFRRMPEYWLMALGSAIGGLSMAVFIFVRSSVWQLCVVTAIAGTGIAMVFAALPLLVVGAVEPGETGSTLGFNQISRTVGGAVGSAISGALLAAYTTGGARFPTDAGYAASGVAGVIVWAGALAVSIPRRAQREAARRGPAAR